VKNEVGRILAERGINPMGAELDRNRLGRTNFVVLKAAIDRRIYTLVDRKAGERSEYSRSELDLIKASLDGLITEAEEEVFNA
jgi:hypothetical protein